MTGALEGARILVADDQPDVARTLCQPLRKSGARLTFVPNGRAALDALSTQVFDLAVLDMKMPPDEWGGLWVLSQLPANPQRTPALVLSGEGAKQQVIQALRHGAVDWIDKISAANELLTTCTRVLEQRLDEALDLAVTLLPSPLAVRYARYRSVTDPEKQVSEGLHVMESILRFTAALGWSAIPATPLRGVAPAQLAKPTMGTWLTICAALADTGSHTPAFIPMFSWLAPDTGDRQHIQSLVSLRNDLHHGRATATVADRNSLDALLRRFATRASAGWHAKLAVASTMTYDENRYQVEILTFRGAGRPAPETVTLPQPAVTGRAVLLYGADHHESLALTPWIVAHQTPDAEWPRLFQTDGIRSAKRDMQPDAPLRYVALDTRNNEADEINAGTWRHLAQWTSQA